MEIDDEVVKAIAGALRLSPSAPRQIAGGANAVSASGPGNIGVVGVISAARRRYQPVRIGSCTTHRRCSGMQQRAVVSDVASANFVDRGRSTQGVIVATTVVVPGR